MEVLTIGMIVLLSACWATSTHIEAVVVPKVPSLTYTWVAMATGFAVLTGLVLLAGLWTPLREFLNRGGGNVAPRQNAMFSLGDKTFIAIADGLILIAASLMYFVTMGWTGKATVLTGLSSPLTLVFVVLIGWVVRKSFIPTWMSGTGVGLAIIAVVLLSLGNGGGGGGKGIQ